MNEARRGGESWEDNKGKNGPTIDVGDCNTNSRVLPTLSEYAVVVPPEDDDDDDDDDDEDDDDDDDDASSYFTRGNCLPLKHKILTKCTKEVAFLKSMMTIASSVLPPSILFSTTLLSTTHWRSLQTVALAFPTASTRDHMSVFAINSPSSFVDIGSCDVWLAAC